MPRSARVPSPTLRDVVAVFFRNKKVWLIAFVAIFVGVVLYGIITPTYQSEMKVMVRRNRTAATATPTLAQTPELNRQSVTEEDLNSEAELLRDKDILARVVQTAGLTSDGISSWIFDRGDENKRFERAVNRLSDRLSVEPVRKTTLISVTYASSNPEESARVLRSLADAYLQRHVQVHRPSGESDFFKQQMEHAEHELNETEMQLMEFSRDEGVVSASMERDAALQKLSEGEAEYRQTKISLAETARRIVTLQSKLGSFPERTTTQIRNSDNPELLEKLKSKLLELQLKRTELLTKYEPTYRLVQEVDQQIAEAKASLASEDQAPLRDETTEKDQNHEWAKSELAKAQVEFDALRSRASAINTQLTNSRDAAHQLGDRAIKQEELLRNLKFAEDKYVLYANKSEEARIGDALDQNRILDVNLAQEPKTPALPMRSAFGFGVIGLALAGTCSTGLAFASDYLDPSFRTPDDVITYLGTPVLASLPERES
ncbi:MAG TPA: Wzz/FepE/Etk N-terminal domain-containing protein [Terriglobales bacterium]|nr:Wzz/FepE/Etk N-terminal domain-containing protein [Terriglobales bacterium]